MGNIKEQIRQEIERLYDSEAPKHDQQCGFDDGYFAGLSTISNFIDSLPEEKPSEDLEEAANKYAILDEEGKWKDGGKYKGFIAGAEWQKSQMLKDAVEGTIICYNDDTYAVESCCFDNKEHHHHSGDKVKIIILKDGE